MGESSSKHHMWEDNQMILSRYISNGKRGRLAMSEATLESSESLDETSNEDRRFNETVARDRMQTGAMEYRARWHGLTLFVTHRCH